jgi:DNA-binding response OmpR family regulator
MTLETKATSVPHITRVMVAENDVDMAYVLEFLLSREGFQVDRLREMRANETDSYARDILTEVISDAGVAA